MSNQQTSIKSSFNHKAIYQEVTDTIIRQLENGTVAWLQPWVSDNKLLGIPRNFATSKKYRGINILLLWCAAIEFNYSSSEWATFNQWQKKKEFISKGEKGSKILYYDTIEKEVDGEIKIIPFVKTSYVFNRCQLTSYVPEKTKACNLDKSLSEIIYPVEEFIENTEAIIENNNYEAYYMSCTDKIHMPYPELFINTSNCTATEGYYSTLMHELTHWTGNPKRLNRQTGKRFGDHSYAFEELVAEFGAAFLCAEFEMAIVEKGNHSNYIAYWLEILKENKQFLIAAASEAGIAVTYLQGLQLKHD